MGNENKENQQKLFQAVRRIVTIVSSLTTYELKERI